MTAPVQLPSTIDLWALSYNCSTGTPSLASLSFLNMPLMLEQPDMETTANNSSRHKERTDRRERGKRGVMGLRRRRQGHEASIIAVRAEPPLTLPPSQERTAACRPRPPAPPRP